MTVVIGGLAARITTADRAFQQVLERQYAAFLSTGLSDAQPDIALTIELGPPADTDVDEDLDVQFENGLWQLRRGDFHATWDPHGRTGLVRQSASRFSIDSVLRILHSLELARSGEGFLLHAASAIRNGKAFVFSGVSGAGKSTISRLAPQDAQFLTDEVSYVRQNDHKFRAWGTPFAGELARSGENVSAPVAALYFLEQSPVNTITRLGRAEALRLLMQNILFFAKDSALAGQVFEIAQRFIASVDVFRLAFAPDERVWEMLR